jgi:hypothetical protein
VVADLVSAVVAVVVVAAGAGVATVADVELELVMEDVREMLLEA